MGETRYAAVARDLLASIAASGHEPGTLLPGEHELAKAHGVSRATVRAALELLERDGLVERRRGAGTRVVAPRAPSGFGQSILTADELIQYARDTRRVVSSVDEIVVDRALAEILGVPPGSRSLHIRSLRIDPARPKHPICASDAYVADTLSMVKDDLSDETTALCDLLAARCGVRVTSIEQELQGAIVPAELAAPLACKAGTPGLRILRRYRDAAGWLFLVTLGLHPADRFAYRMRLDRSSAAT